MGSYIGEACFFESLGRVKEHFPTIKNVYLAGYSGAGAAALALAQNYPGLFSGVISISGLSNPAYTCNLKQIPVVIISSAITDNLYHKAFLDPFSQLIGQENFYYYLPQYFTHRELQYYLYKTALYELVLSHNTENVTGFLMHIPSFATGDTINFVINKRFFCSSHVENNEIYLQLDGNNTHICNYRETHLQPSHKGTGLISVFFIQ